MEDELIDILNEDLSFYKSCLKSEAHKHGWLHASIHVWFFTTDGQILFQKRSPNKIAFPNLWDVSVAGHIASGENKINAALREIEEEIGLKLQKSNLSYIGSFKEKHRHKTDFIDNEIHHIYIGSISANLSSLTIQKEELTEIKLVPINTFVNHLKSPDFNKNYVPHSAAYYVFILNKIQENL